MNTSSKYNKAEIMKAAWSYKKGYFKSLDFATCLRTAWRDAKEKAGNIDITNNDQIAKATKGKVWGDRIYFNSCHGSIYAKINNNGTCYLGLKPSDVNEFTRPRLVSFMEEKANELQSLGLTLR